MASSSSSSIVLISDTDSNDDAAASDALSGPAAERIASTLRTQAAVDALCRKDGVPREFLARPAGDLRACSTPPPGAVCVYAHALETGVRFPLHAFFCDTLNHLGLAPDQLSLNGWRVMVASWAANYVSFSSGYALDLDEKLVARERDNMALWEQLDKEKTARQAVEAELEAVKAELAAAKRATDSELESAKTAAVQQFLASEEHTRRLAEHALAGYERGAEEMKGVVLRHYPRLDAAKLVLPLD